MEVKVEKEESPQLAASELRGLDATIYRLEAYLDAILADVGVYCENISWYRALFQEIGVFNDYFNAFSMTSLRDCIINVNSFQKASWNRSIQLLNLITRCTVGFLVISLLLDWQMPADDGTCTLQGTEELCYSISPAMPDGIATCGWNKERNYCWYEQSLNLSPKLILMTILLAMMITAPVSVVLDHFMWYLLVDLEADPLFNTSHEESSDDEEARVARKHSARNKDKIGRKARKQKKKHEKKRRGKVPARAKVIAQYANEASELAHVADLETLLGKRLNIEEDFTKMRLLFMIERIRQQRELDKERRKLIKNTWKLILPRFSKHQRTARALENVVEYVTLRDQRVEIRSVLEKLKAESTKALFEQSERERYREMLGSFVHVPMTRVTQSDKIDLLLDLMHDIREYRATLVPGPKRDHFDMLWGLESGEGEEETDFEEDEPVGTFNGAARSVFRFHYNIRAPDASEVSKPWHPKSLKDLGWTVPRRLI